ncbi:MAG: nickel-binding protein [Candidatus Dormibacter sp.]
MPQFIDYHDELKLPADALDTIREETKSGKVDQYGVRQLELYHNAEGKVYCLLDGPNEEAVRQHHAALDVPCGAVHEVKSLL